MSPAELRQPCPGREEDPAYRLLLQKCSSAPPPLAEEASTGSPGGSSRGSSSSSTAEGARGAPAAAPSAVRQPRARPAKGDLRLLCNVQVHGADQELRRLLASAQELSEATFGEDCLRDVTRRSRWQLTLLVSSDRAEVFGFVVTKSVNGSLAIAKLAVSPECRGMGLGRHFMEEVMKAAKRRGDIYEVCLSSLAAAVTFYQRLGFKAFKDLKVAVDFEVEEGQVYMEKKLRPRPRRR